MNAENRLLRVDFILSYLLVYYSTSLAALQLSPLYFEINNEGQFNWITTTMSIFVLLFSTIMASSNFKLRADKMKSSYILLTQLEYDLSYGSSASDIASRYTLILDRTDNHSQRDYEKAQLWSKAHPDETVFSTIYRHLKYAGITAAIYIVVIASLAIPFLLLIKFIYPELKNV
ncbi:hypothetical protein AZI86_00435 [Bdellovibrio bacteriovorus]|uniref:SMODS and SLOG-associating 2TM effector domain-containing protein n=2 Tax=Bdellovibrio bacteriovorus TaxID=959 RepID=A0A150WM97_BDEBC|nr:hypothetical protein AZI86_00435 [Bdellovibrio bacteriovorus]